MLISSECLIYSAVNLSKLYGCEQLDLIFQEINDIISDTVDETWSLNKAIVEQYRSEGLSDEDITKGIEWSVLQGLEERGMDIRLREKIDDGGGIYIPSLNLCISGHEIREIYAPHLAKGEKVRKEVKGMKVKALKKRAKEIGIDEEQLKDVDYREDVKVAIITLILKQIDHPPEGISEDIWRKVKRILQADDYVNEEVMNVHKAYGYGYSGDGVTIHVQDSGFDKDHHEFNGKTVTLYQTNYTSDTTSSYHANSVASIALGDYNGISSGDMNSSTGSMMGVAYNADLYFSATSSGLEF